jgi:hypothetical protein
MLLFSTFLSQGVFADSMSERMKIREELSGVSSDGQNIMSASTAEDDSPNGNCARGACHIGPPGRISKKQFKAVVRTTLPLGWTSFW